MWWDRKSIDFRAGFKFICLALITAVIGAKLAHNIDVNLLIKLFALYLVGIGVYFLISTKRPLII